MLLTLLVQSSNFIFDWRILSFREHVTVNEVIEAGDNQHYWGLAQNLLSGKGYTAPFDEMMSVKKGLPTYLRSPGLPLIYTVPLSLFCRDSDYELTQPCKREVWLFLYVCNVLLLGLGTVYLHKLSRHLTGHHLLSVCCALVYIVWPSNLVFLSPYAGTIADVLVTPLLIWILYVTITNKQSTVAVLAGFVLGFCMLTRVYLVLLPGFFLAAAVLSQGRELRRRLATVAVVSLIVLAPWPLRNYLVFHDFSLSSQGGRHLWLGNNSSARGSYDGVLWREGPMNAQQHPALKVVDDKYPGLIDMSRFDETQASRVLRDEALRWMKGNLPTMSWLLWRKFAVTMFPTNFENGNKVNVLTFAVFLLFVPGCLLFLYHHAKGLAPRESLLVLTPLVCGFAVTLIYYAEYRVRFVMEPFMILFVFYGIGHWLNRCYDLAKPQSSS